MNYREIIKIMHTYYFDVTTTTIYLPPPVIYQFICFFLLLLLSPIHYIHMNDSAANLDARGVRHGGQLKPWYIDKNMRQDLS